MEYNRYQSPNRVITRHIKFQLRMKVDISWSKEHVAKNAKNGKKQKKDKPQNEIFFLVLKAIRISFYLEI